MFCHLVVLVRLSVPVQVMDCVHECDVFTFFLFTCVTCVRINDDDDESLLSEMTYKPFSLTHSLLCLVCVCVCVSVCMCFSGFLRRPSIQGQLWKVLEFRKLKKSLNCFGKRVEGLEKFGICLSWNIAPIDAYKNWRNKTRWLGDCQLPAIVAGKLVEELLRPFY